MCSFDVDELFFGMADRRKAISLISKRDHCQKSSPSWIIDMPRAGFEPAKNLNSSFVEWRCAIMISTILRRHGSTTPILLLSHYGTFLLELINFAKQFLLTVTIKKILIFGDLPHVYWNICKSVYDAAFFVTAVNDF